MVLFLAFAPDGRTLGLRESVGRTADRSLGPADPGRFARGRGEFAMSSVPARRLFTTLQQRIAPVHTAVIVVDMQNDYVSIGGAGHRRHGSVEAAQSIIPALQTLLSSARRVGALVVYIQMTM